MINRKEPTASLCSLERVVRRCGPRIKPVSKELVVVVAGLGGCQTPVMQSGRS